MVLARALDAISDPCMGLLADRTRSRWGKFRPWILFGAIPFGLVCVLAYSSPDLSHNGKLIYAAVTYTLLTLLYTVVNIPYCALGGVITDNPTQRISLQSWRFVLATAGGMLSTVRMTIDDVMDAAGLPLAGIVPEDPHVALAASFGQSLLRYSPNCIAHPGSVPHGGGACPRDQQKAVGELRRQPETGVHPTATWGFGIWTSLWGFPNAARCPFGTSPRGATPWRTLSGTRSTQPSRFRPPP